MAKAARFNAKTPTERFGPDVAAKRRAVSNAIDSAIERHGAQAYAKLEQLRCAAAEVPSA